MPRLAKEFSPQHGVSEDVPLVQMVEKKVPSPKKAVIQPEETEPLNGSHGLIENNGIFRPRPGVLIQEAPAQKEPPLGVQQVQANKKRKALFKPTMCIEEPDMLDLAIQTKRTISFDKDLEAADIEALTSEKPNQESILGNGQFGIAFKHNLKGKEVVVKKGTISDNEVRLPLKFDCPHLSKVLGLGWDVHGQRVLVQSWEGVTLSPGYVKWLKDNGQLSTEAQWSGFTSDLLEGLTSLHEKGVVHCDIKPENLTLSKKLGYRYCLCLIDFGTARQYGKEKASGPGGMSPEYLPPSANKMISMFIQSQGRTGFNEITPKQEMWSVAMVMAYLNHGFHLMMTYFLGLDNNYQDNDHRVSILSQIGDFSSGLPQGLQRMLQLPVPADSRVQQVQSALLRLDDSSRPTAKTALDFLKGERDDLTERSACTLTQGFEQLRLRQPPLAPPVPAKKMRREVSLMEEDQADTSSQASSSDLTINLNNSKSSNYQALRNKKVYMEDQSPDEDMDRETLDYILTINGAQSGAVNGATSSGVPAVAQATSGMPAVAQDGYQETSPIQHQETAAERQVETEMSMDPGSPVTLGQSDLSEGQESSGLFGGQVSDPLNISQKSDKAGVYVRAQGSGYYGKSGVYTRQESGIVYRGPAPGLYGGQGSVGQRPKAVPRRPRATMLQSGGGIVRLRDNKGQRTEGLIIGGTQKTEVTAPNSKNCWDEKNVSDGELPVFNHILTPKMKNKAKLFNPSESA